MQESRQRVETHKAFVRRSDEREVIALLHPRKTTRRQRRTDEEGRAKAGVVECVDTKNGNGVGDDDVVKGLSGRARSRGGGEEPGKFNQKQKW